jgi:undecaprenyl diphosphate synthase
MPIYFALQSTLHVGIIMDGNGRWALARGLSRQAGHRAGVDTASRIVETAPSAGIGILTLFAFSSDNWRRPRPEVEALMRLLEMYLVRESDRCVANGVRFEIIGRRDRLGESLAGSIARIERASAGGTRLWLRIAIDYSGRDAILAATRHVLRGQAPLSRESLEKALGPPVDLLIRTGGERRLSDFLLWECAYAELVFSPRMWPDFDAADLTAAIREYRGRHRRFGGLPPPPPIRRQHAWLE